MNVLIILGHPNKKSFNHSIAETCKEQIESNGHTVFFHDLYAENFNPLLHNVNANSNNSLDEQVKVHCNNLMKSDGIIIVHPNWWGQPPAIVKGWMDRVLLPGVAYDFVENENGEHTLIGLLKAQNAIIFNSSNSPYDKESDPLASIWKNSVFNFCGVKNIEQRNCCLVTDSDDNQRDKWLEEVQGIISTRFTKQP